MLPHEECPDHEGEPRHGCGPCGQERRAERERADETARERSERIREEALATMRRDVELAKGWTERGGRQ
ncbi:MAG TPA: hypothetical protein VFH80_23675 [Solirubrobacteraceae bacterium]|nr:hypothetical protein [Solirubrobacteraceae bacterium]